MTDRDKVIRGLECCIKRDPDDNPRCGECPYDGACLNRLKIDALELLKEEEVVEPTVAKDIKVPDKWVSVKDRLPEKSGQYLCWFGANKVAIGPAIVTYVDEWKAFGNLVSLEKYPNITHWMPLPEPPKEDNNEGS